MVAVFPGPQPSEKPCQQILPEVPVTLRLFLQNSILIYPELLFLCFQTPEMTCSMLFLKNESKTDTVTLFSILTISLSKHLDLKVIQFLLTFVYFYVFIWKQNLFEVFELRCWYFSTRIFKKL